MMMAKTTAPNPTQTTVSYIFETGGRPVKYILYPKPTRYKIIPIPVKNQAAKYPWGLLKIQEIMTPKADKIKAQQAQPKG